MPSKTIMLSLGSRQVVLRDRNSCLKEDFDLFTDILTINRSSISKNGGSAMLSIINGKPLTMRVSPEKAKLSSEGSAIVMLAAMKDGISSRCFYGESANANFENSNLKLEVSLDNIKEFANSWGIEALDIYNVLFVEDEKLFTEIVKDPFFNDYIVLNIMNRG